MHEVELPINEMTKFDLPPICVISGGTENVTFRPVKFQWYPRWVAVFGCAPLIMVILMLALMRKAKGELPFSDAGWESWRRAKLALGVSLGAMMALLAAGVVLLETDSALGLLLIGLSVVQLVVVSFALVKGKGPQCAKIDKEQIVLKLPSAEAADRIRAHLVAGKAA